MSMFRKTDIMKTLDATLGAWLCSAFGVREYLRGNESPARIQPERIKRVLVIRPGGMGDMVVLLPVLNLLKERFPDAEIDIVCEKRNVGVLKLAQAPGSALIYDTSPIAFLWKLRRRNYDVAIDTEQFHHFSAVFAAIAGAPARIGFKINPRRNPLYTHLVNYAPDAPEGEQFMRLLEPLSIGNVCYDLEGSLSRLKLEQKPETAKKIEDVAGAKGYAVFHAGTSSAYKLWAPANFIRLAGMLHQQRGFGIVLVGGRGDIGVSRGIAKSAADAGCKIVSLAGELDIGGAAAVIKDARVFVGSDSGLAHLAIALGTNTTVLFGPSDHLKWGFADHHHAVVRSDLPCAPCFIFGYHKPCRSIGCMSGITVEEVMSAIVKAL